MVKKHMRRDSATPGYSETVPCHLSLNGQKSWTCRGASRLKNVSRIQKEVFIVYRCIQCGFMDRWFEKMYKCASRTVPDSLGLRPWALQGRWGLAGCCEHPLLLGAETPPAQPWTPGPLGPLLTQHPRALTATAEPPCWLLQGSAASALPHSHQHLLWELERLKRIIDTNHDQRRNDCHCKNVFINDLHIILWEWYSARQNCDRFSPNGNISLQKCVALKGLKKPNVFPPVRKMTDQGQETIH